MNFYHFLPCFCLLLPLSASATVRYVDLNSPGPAAPFTTWATAATNIQDAIDAAVAGDEIVVTNGVYATGGRALSGLMTNRVTVDKAVSVRSLNGPQFTVIQGRQVPGITNGDGAVRCAYLSTGAFLSGFTLTNGATRTAGLLLYDRSGGGVLNIAGVVSNCVVIGNSADADGGGVDLAYIGDYIGACYNSVIVRNSANWGGGAAGGLLYNCVLSRNTAGSSGGGANGSTMYNCTVTGNTDTYGGGGTYDCYTRNSIIYFNSPANHYLGSLAYSCSTLPEPGAGNIALDPQLASLTRLSASSPCRGAGSSVPSTKGTDIDGEPWNTPPSMGCDEIHPGTATGPLTVRFSASFTDVMTDMPLSFTADIEGRPTASVWNYGDGVISSNQPVASHSWSGAGDFPVVLTAYNDSNPAGVSTTVLVHVVSRPIHHVAIGNPNPSAPYSSWATAATNIQDAVDAATIHGATVLVSNGVYRFGGRAVQGTMTNRVAVNKVLNVKSLNGPDYTTIEGLQLPGVINGDGAIRCVYLTNGASLAGFTLTGGATRTNGNYLTEIVGGGAWCEPSGAVLSNCVIRGNSAAESAGGVYRGVVLDSVVSDNQARYGGGCAYSSLSNSTIMGNVASVAGGGGYGSSMTRCWLTDNLTQGDGGGAHTCGLINCAVVGNMAVNGGGIYGSGGQAYSCTVVSNSAVNGGGVYGSTNFWLYNSIVYFNSAPNGSNYYAGQPYGISVGFDGCCTAPLPINGYNGGNITNDPVFVDLVARNLRLQSNSPCIEAGDNSYVNFSSVPDLDGNSRVLGSRVDIGAYEYPDLVAPRITTQPLDQTVTESLEALFTIGVVGSVPFSYQWRLNGHNLPNETNYWLTLYDIQISQAGLYSAVVSNAAGSVTSDDAILTVNQSVTHYVDAASANSVTPFTSWETAAQTIQDAVDAAVGGDKILVTNGVYAVGGRAVYGAMTNRVAAAKPVRIRSVNGPPFTIIQGRQVPGTTVGDGAIRCVYLSGGASLTGFTLTNGATQMAGDTVYELSGGGVLINSGVVSNCVIAGNFANLYGGGVYGVYSHAFYNCVIVSNTAAAGGGGSGEMYNCTIVGNSASSQGGGTWGGQYKNCIVYYNTAPSAPNYSAGYKDYCCTTPLPNGGIMNITNPPLFVNQAGGDFRLQPGSPCIDDGNSSFAPGGSDLGGDPRIRGNSVDIGAFEFQGSQPVLQIAPSGTNILLAWPLWASDFELQQAAMVPPSSGDWSVVSASPVVLNGENTVALPIAGDPRLFRLFKP